jgi:hypothetical protein
VEVERKEVNKINCNAVNPTLKGSSHEGENQHQGRPAMEMVVIGRAFQRRAVPNELGTARRLPQKAKKVLWNLHTSCIKRVEVEREEVNKINRNAVNPILKGSSHEGKNQHQSRPAMEMVVIGRAFQRRAVPTDWELPVGL